MTKRAHQKFPRRKQDAYDTPYEAVLPLIPHLPSTFSYCEPCAGSGQLCKHLDKATESNAVLTDAIDVAPRADWIDVGDAMLYMAPSNSDFIITNPPWSRDILHPMILHFSEQCPTWLLFDADWMHTKQASPYLERCVKIVSVGRVSWLQNGTSGFDNCCWYLFRCGITAYTEFHGRQS